MIPPRSRRVTVLDHYDSFTFNLVELLARLGAQCTVLAHDRIDLSELENSQPDGLLLSPGPGHPRAATLARSLLCTGRWPCLGVCLGHQVVGLSFGATVSSAKEILHGKTCSVVHRGQGIFKGLPSPYRAARYNSLALDRLTLPPELEVTAVDARGEIMGLSHVSLPIHGVQFHPESASSEYGLELMQNWLASL